MTILVLGQLRAHLVSIHTDFHLLSHFVRETLPKIRFDNPNLEIEVERVKKTKEERWRPEMELEFGEC